MPTSPTPGPDTRGSGARRRLALGALCLFFLFGIAPASAAPPAPRVRVLGPAERPIPGAEVFVSRDARWVKAGVTGSDGRFTLTDAPTDGTAIAAARFRTRPYDPEHESLAGARIQGLELVLRVPAAELTVTGTDARTGVAVPEFRWRDDPTEQFASTPRIRPFGPSWLGEPFRGLDVQALSGYVAWDPSVDRESTVRGAAPGWTRGIAPGVRSVIATYPLRPEARIAFSLHGASGKIPVRACTWRFAGDGDLHEAEEETVADATQIVVPWFPGATIEYEISGAGMEESPFLVPVGAGRVVLGPDPTPLLTVAARAIYREESTTVPLPSRGGLWGIGQGHSSRGGNVRVRAAVQFGPLPEGLTVDLESEATREVEGLGRHPEHSFSSQVGVSGLAWFERVPPGAYHAQFWQPGYLPARAACRVSIDHITEVDLKEPAGGLVEVTVVGIEHGPLPFARLTVRGEGWGEPLDVIDGVQRVDPFVGLDGTRTLHRVAPGPVTIEAVWGSFRGEARGVVEDGKPLAIRIQARDAASR